MNFTKSFAALALAATAGLASATTITNPGFESGTLAGWNLSPASSGLVGVETDDVVVGAFAAELIAGRGENLYTYITQDIAMNAGDHLYGWAKWIGEDESPFNDDAFITIYNQDTNVTTTLFAANIATFGDYVAGPWTYFNFAASVAGDYTVKAGVRNVGDNGLGSQLLVDFSTVPVPEPEGMSLMLAGLGALALVARRRKAA